MGDKKVQDLGLDDDTLKQVKVNVLLMKAREAYEEGEYETAASLLKEALVIVPGNPSVWFDLASTYREASMVLEEIDCYKTIIELGEDAAWLNMALAFRVIGKQAEELYCLIMIADRGVEFFEDEEAKVIFIDRYRELVHAKVRARSPLSSEDKVPIYDKEAFKDHAGPELANCIVCFQKMDLVKEEGRVLICPHCQRVSHFVCLASWLQNNDACPVCQGMLDFSLEDYDMKKVLLGGDE